MSVTIGTSVREQMNIGAIAGFALGALLGGFAIGLPLALTNLPVFGYILGSIAGGVIGGAACGAFLGGTAPLIAAKVRQYMDQKNLTPNDTGISDHDL